MTMSIRFDLTPTEQKAFAMWAAEHGRTWKGDLVRAWRTRMGLRGHAYQEALQRLQHVLGEPGLDRIELDIPKKPTKKSTKKDKK